MVWLWPRPPHSFGRSRPRNGPRASRLSRGKVSVRSLWSARGRISFSQISISCRRRSFCSSSRRNSGSNSGSRPVFASSATAAIGCSLQNPRISITAWMRRPEGRDRAIVAALRGRRYVRTALRPRARAERKGRCRAACRGRTLAVRAAACGRSGQPASDPALGLRDRAATASRAAHGSTRRRPVATDLERFVSAEGRDEQVRRVREQIDKLGITYVYYQFPSVTGRIMGKGVPAAHWETIAREGLPARLRRDGEPLHRPPRQLHRLRAGGRRSSSASPSPRRSSRCRGTRRSARVWCTCFRNREERKDPGAFLTSDCRGNLKRIQAEFEAATGLHLRAGTEPEMMWLKLNEDGTPAVAGRDEALLLPHRPVLRAPADHPPRRRVRATRWAST